MHKWIVPITTTCLILGLLLTLQIRLQNNMTPANTNDKTQTLISLVTNLESEIADYEMVLSALRQDTEKITAKASNGEDEVKALQNNLVEEQAKIGLTALEGPGIVITLDDNKAGSAASPQDDPNYYLIHYENLLYLINDLKGGKAEAISVNDQRIVSSSEIRCVGNTILVNTTRLAPPFVIQAIGDVSSLEKSILENSEVYSILKDSGFPVSYKTTGLTMPTISISAYTGSFPTKHLSPVTTEGE